jgi:hypothetical protein
MAINEEDACAAAWRNLGFTCELQQPFLQLYCTFANNNINNQSLETYVVMV